MNAEEFVRGMQELVVDSALANYREIFSSTDAEKLKAGYWKDSLEFYNRLSREDKEVFFRIVRFIEMETLTRCFAVLDGESQIGGDYREFTLREEGDEVTINGDLTTIYINIENPGGQKYI